MTIIKSPYAESRAKTGAGVCGFCIIQNPCNTNLTSVAMKTTYHKGKRSISGMVHIFLVEVVNNHKSYIVLQRKNGHWLRLKTNEAQFERGLGLAQC